MAGSSPGQPRRENWQSHSKGGSAQEVTLRLFACQYANIKRKTGNGRGQKVTGRDKAGNEGREMGGSTEGFEGPDKELVLDMAEPWKSGEETKDKHHVV